MPSAVVNRSLTCNDTVGELLRAPSRSRALLMPQMFPASLLPSTAPSAAPLFATALDGASASCLQTSQRSGRTSSLRATISLAVRRAEFSNAQARQWLLTALEKLTAAR